MVDAVSRCFQSARSATALSYREHNGLQTDHPAMAILIQQMVESDVSAVAFSVNPISGDPEQVMVTAA